MSEIAIKVENLSKVYRIGAQRKADNSLRFAVVDYFKSRTRRLTGKSLLDDAEDTIWALKDVSLEVKQGEVIGIIGRNGAGKSTLLKILSRITEPTKGRIELRGRVVSLLEVGTGFHPELTGRENVFLNGSIMGMRRDEIRSRFDEIVAFAEIDKFIDTPVKRYSSGMYVRLAFSVAAHLEPKILLVDEVLAVGDIAFQAKCYNKIGQMRDEDMTVIMVSHNLHIITNLCERVAYLNRGEIDYNGEPKRAIALYTTEMLNSNEDKSMDDGCDMSLVNGTGRVVITNIKFIDKSGSYVNNIRSGDSFTVRISYRSNGEIENPILDVVIRDSGMDPLFQATNRTFGMELGKLGGKGYVDIDFKNVNINNQVANFAFSFWNSNFTELFDWKRFTKLQVHGNPMSNGRMMFDCEWRNVICR